MSMPIALTPGTVIGGHYIIGNLINRGGFGAVYRGTDTSEGNRPCAIKEIYDVTPAARRQALMEASVLFTIRSKNLPEVYDALEANGRFYLIMQLIEGKNLLQILRSRVPGGFVGEQEPHQQSQGPCSEQEVLTWLLPIMDVLQELHSRNPPIMHRDIKPGNIILTPQHTTVLVDFGLTKLYDPNKDTQTMTRAVTAGFSPVEQYMGKTSPQSDIYSMAATMYLLLTNRLPPAAIHRSMQDTLIAPRQLNPALSPKIERALLKALSLQASDRYQSMREFADALRERGFSAYSDRTIATPPVSSTGSQSRTLAGQQATPTAPQHAYAPRQTATQPALQAPPHPRMPQPGIQSASYPYLPPLQGPGTTPQPPLQPMQPHQPLPTPFGQGCLWAIIGGILTASMVLFLPRNVALVEAVLVGLLFYMIAGYFTTHKGGSSLRGGWAGFWTGLIGFFTFWVSFFSGLAAIIIPSILRRFPHMPVVEAARRAWQTVQPTWPGSSGASQQTQQSPFISFIIQASIWLAIAFALGWIGGLLGHERYKARMARRAQRAMKIAPKVK
ncbi:MAG TPA: protein kinase [Ktedonobacteraceae bacterium]|nr:protein kinase [Ktedonobacteraceae bacterium]